MARILPALVLSERLVSTTASHRNSTFTNPILRGVHPIPICIFVPAWDKTYSCASSSLGTFPEIPIHASREPRNWKPRKCQLGTRNVAGTGHYEQNNKWHMYMVTVVLSTNINGAYEPAPHNPFLQSGHHGVLKQWATLICFRMLAGTSGLPRCQRAPGRMSKLPDGQGDGPDAGCLGCRRRAHLSE